MNRKVYVVIPAYQPDQRLVELVDQLVINHIQVIVVDDGSGEEYKKVFDQLSCKVEQYEENKGKGYALKYGYRSFENLGCHDVVVTSDCDGQHSLGDILRIAQKAKENYGALILGKREFQKGEVPFKSKVGNRITAKVFNAMTGLHLTDTQTGLRAFSGSQIESMCRIQGDAYEYEMNVLMVLAKEKKKIIEMPIETIYEDNNKGSHFNGLTDSLKIYLEIMKFASSSFICFVVDFIAYSLIFIFAGVVAANIGARMISSSVNFILNRKYVFESEERVGKSAVKYFTLVAGILVANTLLLMVLTSWLGLNALLSKVLVEIILFGISWVVQKKVVFRKAGVGCLNVN